MCKLKENLYTRNLINITYLIKPDVIPMSFNSVIHTMYFHILQINLSYFSINDTKKNFISCIKSGWNGVIQEGIKVDVSQENITNRPLLPYLIRKQ